jgi:dienelactone hydrolase
VACVCALGSAEAATPPPVEAFGKRPATLDVDLNPSGTRLAWIEDDGQATRIVIHDLVAKKDLRRMTAPQSTRVRTVLWATDETLLFDQRVTRGVAGGGSKVYEWQRWTAVDASGGSERILLMQGGDREWVTGASLIRRQTSRPGKVFMSSLDFNETKYREQVGTRLSGGKKDAGWIENLYEVDLATGGGRVIAAGTPFTHDWLSDAAGERVVRSEYNPKRDFFEIVVREGGGWKRLYQSENCGRLSLLGLNFDDTAAVVGGSPCNETREKIWSLPLDGSPMSVIVEDPELDVESYYLDPLDGRVLAIAMSGAERPIRWLDPKAEKRIAGLQKSFGTHQVRLLSRSTDYQRVAVQVDKPQEAPVFYFVDYTAKSAQIINEHYPQLVGVKLAPVREFRYQARDQYPLVGYLTVPPDASAKGLAVVVLPHGGPEARDDPGFDYMAQFFASRGYAVFQPQFRGSSGFGAAHADAGRRQWGLRMQDDVTDGVKALIDQGIADARRVCIVGGSYGGYAALAGVAFTPELYACAASINGVTDLPNFIGYITRQGGDESNALYYWREHIGPPGEPQVIARSPARHVAAIRAPILLLHGSQDTTVPITQSQAMARALTAAKKSFQFIELPGDDHFLSSSAMRVRALTELEKFLALHLTSPQVAAN